MSNEANRIEIVRSGGIAALVSPLKGTSKQIQYASAALAELARWNHLKTTKFGRTHGVPLLINLLQGLKLRE